MIKGPTGRYTSVRRTYKGNGVEVTSRYANEVTVAEDGDRLSLLDVMRMHWMAVLLIILLFVALGLAYTQLVPNKYEATAEIIVQDPRADTLVNIASPDARATMSSERNLADQVTILESAEVAETASNLMAGEFSSQYILRNRTIVGSATSNLIEVSFIADEPEQATSGADALVEAYLDVRRRQIQETANLALTRVDALQEALDQELAEIQQQIDAELAGDEASQELNNQMDAALQELNALRLRRNEAAPGSEERALINTQIDELMSDYEGWQTVLEVQRQNPELEQLLAQQNALSTERAELAGRQNSIAVDAELAAGIVTLVSPAQTPTGPAGLSSQMILAAMVILGVATAATVAYYLSQRRGVITDRAMPERLIEAPLLAVVPEFDIEGSLTHLPMSAAPESPAAEAFRFAAGAISSRSSTVGARSILFTSPNLHAGTTTVLANTAIAATLSGLRVAIIDADFKQQRLSRLLSLKPDVGMTDVVEGMLETKEALTQAHIGDQQSISVLQRGRPPAELSSFLNQDSARRMLLELAEEFDLVLIDAPPLLQVAYANTLARAADSAVLVVQHGSSVETLEETSDRLDLVDTRLLGYIYTRAPIKAEHRYAGSIQKTTERQWSLVGGGQSGPKS